MPIEGLKEECGLFAVHGLEDAALHTALALHAQQHRGQEGAGIVTLHEGEFQTHKAAGLVSDHFSADAGGFNLDGEGIALEALNTAYRDGESGEIQS